MLPYELRIAVRSLTSRRRAGFPTVMAWITVMGILLGVMALVVALSFASGFQSALRDRIIGVNAHLLLMRYDGLIEGWREVERRLGEIEGVEGVMPFTYHQALVRSDRNVEAGVVRGIVPAFVQQMAGWGVETVCGSLEARDVEGAAVPEDGKAETTVWLGRVLAENLGVTCGGSVDLVALTDGEGETDRARIATYRVGGVFDVGMYEYDASLALAPLAAAQAFFGMQGAVTGMEVRLEALQESMRREDALGYRLAERVVGRLVGVLGLLPGLSEGARERLANGLEGWLEALGAETTLERIRRVFGYPYWIKTWQQINPNFFSALKLQKIVMFLILILIVLVGGFNIISTLIMSVIERRREVAILKALGATQRAIGRVFLYQGALLAACGTALGLLGGYVVCRFSEAYPLIRLDPDVYYLSHLPVEVRPVEFAVVGGAAMILSVLATVYPARQAGKLDPAEVLRYE